LRLAEVIEPYHVEILQFNERVHIESEKLFKLALKAFSLNNYAKAMSLIQHAISLSPLDMKLHIIKAKIHRMAGELQAALEAIEGVALLFERAMRTVDYNGPGNVSCTSSSSSSSIKQARELPADIELQRNLIINDMALTSAGKGDYIRAIALLNKVLENHSRVDSRVVLTRPALTQIEIIQNKAEEVRTVQYTCTFGTVLECYHSWRTIRLCWT
jgi:tetratricopeptide (TPR) repeat protein